MFENKTLLITGGTGSFGHAVLKRFLDTEIKEIRIFSRDEKKQEDMRLAFKNPKLTFYLGDVRSPESLQLAMHGVDYVFHAAALKQVPSCEFYPMEAIKTNIIGTENVLEIAIKQQVRKVIILSTDKAVYPINAMGQSKALAEKIMLAKSRMLTEQQTILCATRYGNVMGSRGSVIPLFKQQIEEGQPLTITEPQMTRFLMSLEEAVDLVLYAYEEGEQGDIFVQKAPACTIYDLAIAIKNIMQADNELKIIGTRHGEKLYETLLTREELARAIDLGNYYKVGADNRHLNYDKYFVEGENHISGFEDYNSHNTEHLNLEEIMNAIASLDIFAELPICQMLPKGATS